MHLFQPLAGIVLLTAVAAGCEGGNKAASATRQTAAQQTTATDVIPVFNSDSAYAYVKAQVDMGPRVPGSAAHARCGAWIKSELARHEADTVLEQRATVINPNDNTPLPIVNIMGRYNPDATERILLVAHYDTRPTADEDPDASRRNLPIDGANDGGSGVGVLLEIARQLSISKPSRGIDLLFVDAEDMGQSDDPALPGEGSSWCLGSQYWALHHPYNASTMPDMAMVLDMVGGKGAKFHREQFSDHYAPRLVDFVWQAADRAGYGDRFINMAGGPILDDHLPLLRIGIPTIDIVESRSDLTGTFPATWHTHADNIDNIDRKSLEAAGQTTLAIIHSPIIKK